MPNLGAVINDPAELKRSVDRVCGVMFTRKEPKLNHGVKTPEELRDKVCQKPFPFENINSNDLHSSEST